jgi:ER membrane protein complex subunit 2
MNVYWSQRIANVTKIHARLAEIIYTSSESISNVGELARVLAESMRRYLRSIELCENYLRGYYGLKLVGQL